MDDEEEEDEGLEEDEEEEEDIWMKMKRRIKIGTKMRRKTRIWMKIKRRTKILMKIKMWMGATMRMRSEMMTLSRPSSRSWGQPQGSQIVRRRDSEATAIVFEFDEEFMSSLSHVTSPLVMP